MPKKESDILKIPKKLWKEVIDLLQESINHLDFDFDFQGSDNYENRLEKLLEKLENNKLPVNPWDKWHSDSS